METTAKIEVTYCAIDKLFYIRQNNEDLHYQSTRPTRADIADAIHSDMWTERFNDMRSGKRVRVSARIYYDMLCSVPPKRQTDKSFYCGEAYSGSLHYYFERDDNGVVWGELKALG